MKEKILQIQKALNAEAYFPALALTLTLPDICGQVEYPTENSSKKRYINWFNEHVTPIFKIPVNEKECNYKFDGKACYALRCAFLHAGDYDLQKGNKKVKNEDEKVQIDIFKLHIDNNVKDYGSYSKFYIEEGKRIVDLDIYSLCKAIVMKAHEYYEKYDNKELFSNAIVIDESWSKEDFNKIFKFIKTEE